MNERLITNYYDDLAKNYDQDRFSNSYGKFIDKCERNILNQLLSSPEETTILDLACGSGRFLNFATLGIDASKEMVAVAQQKFPDKKIYQADAEKTPLENSCADTILIFHLFMHLDRNKIDKIFAECSRILKKNGRIIFDIPSKKRRQALGYKSQDWHGAFSFSLNDLKSISGFKVKRTFGYLFLPIHRFPALLRPFLSKIDTFLANSFLKEYSSYLIIEIEKNETT